MNDDGTWQWEGRYFDQCTEFCFESDDAAPPPGDAAVDAAAQLDAGGLDAPGPDA